MHQILRVKLELTVAEQPLAAPLLARASLLHERRIAPLLARICDELDEPNLMRLGRIEVDLGTISHDDLEDDLIRKLGPALRAALTRALAAAARPTRSDTSLELLKIFARTGNLPWWCDPTREDPISAALTTTIAAAPHALIDLLRELADDPPALARLARHCDRTPLARLVAHVSRTASTALSSALETPAPDRRSLTHQQTAILTSLARPNSHETLHNLDAIVQTLHPDPTRHPAHREPTTHLSEEPPRDTPASSRPAANPTVPHLSDETLAPFPRADPRAREPGAQNLSDETLAQIPRADAHAPDPLTSSPAAAPLNPPEEQLRRVLARIRDVLAALESPTRRTGAPVPRDIPLPSAPHRASHREQALDPRGHTELQAPDPGAHHRDLVDPVALVNTPSLAEDDPDRPDLPDATCETPTDSLGGRQALLVTPESDDPSEPTIAPVPRYRSRPLAVADNPAALADSTLTHLRRLLAHELPESTLAHLHPLLVHPTTAPISPAPPESTLAQLHELLALLNNPHSPAPESPPARTREPLARPAPNTPHIPQDPPESTLARIHELLAHLNASRIPPTPPETPPARTREPLAQPTPNTPHISPTPSESTLAHRHERRAPTDSPARLLTLTAPSAVPLANACESHLLPLTSGPKFSGGGARGADSPARATRWPTLGRSRAGPRDRARRRLGRFSVVGAAAGRSRHAPRGRPANLGASAIPSSAEPVHAARSAPGELRARGIRRRPNPVQANVDPPEPAARRTSPIHRSPPNTPPSREASPTSHRSREQPADLQVTDAGLVLLWPFLDRLFTRTGLLDESQFIDDEAPMQAIAQLSYIVSGDPDPAEYHLPLAKLLCGRRPDSEYRLTRPLTPEQRRECEDLLTAVLDHAVLRDATIDGLRAALLRRPATLGVRDHARLLRVERRPHDRILAQLPWSWSWVKLPWMCEPLQVEW